MNAWIKILLLWLFVGLKALKRKISVSRAGHRVPCTTPRLVKNFITSRADWASECPDVKNYKWRLNPVWHRMHYSCTRMATVGFKGLIECYMTQSEIRSLWNCWTCSTFCFSLIISSLLCDMFSTHFCSWVLWIGDLFRSLCKDNVNTALRSSGPWQDNGPQEFAIRSCL